MASLLTDFWCWPRDNFASDFTWGTAQSIVTHAPGRTCGGLMTLAGILVDLFDLSHVTCRMLAAHALWADVCSSCAAACSRFSMGQTRGPRPFFISLSFVGLLHDESNCVWHVWFVVGFPPLFLLKCVHWSTSGCPAGLRDSLLCRDPNGASVQCGLCIFGSLVLVGHRCPGWCNCARNSFHLCFSIVWLYDFMMFHVLSVLLWHSLVFRPPYCPALGDWVRMCDPVLSPWAVARAACMNLRCSGRHVLRLSLAGCAAQVSLCN